MGDVIQVAEHVAKAVGDDVLAAIKADERYAPLVEGLVEKALAALGVVASAG